MPRRSIAATAAAVLTAALILFAARPVQASPPASGDKWCSWGSHSVPSPVPGVDPRTHWRIGSKANVSAVVIACPDALALATPTAITVGVGNAACSGVLFKNATALESTAGVDTVVFDKTER